MLNNMQSISTCVIILLFHLCDPNINFYSSLGKAYPLCTYVQKNPTNCLLEVANRSRPGQDIACVAFVDRLVILNRLEKQGKFKKQLQLLGVSACWFICVLARDWGWADWRCKLTYDNWGRGLLGTVTTHPLRGAFSYPSRSRQNSFANHAFMIVHILSLHLFCFKGAHETL